MHPALIWTILGLILLVIELFTMTFFLMWVGAAALLTALMALFVHVVWVQYLVFGVLSVVLLVASRPMARSIHGRVAVPSNVDRLLGETGVVLETIDGTANTGRVRVGSDEWRARSTEIIPQGARVTVKKVEGTTLWVVEQE